MTDDTDLGGSNDIIATIGNKEDQTQMDFQLIGAIVSAILEKLSQARDMESTFDYVPQFHVLDKTYSLENCGEYMKLSVVE